MALDTKHPLYADTIEDQTLMRDSYAGERRMKEKNEKYLPPTPGMVLDGMEPNQDGWKNYQAYKQRARYPEFVSDAVEYMLGMMHGKPPVIEVPDAMAKMVERATADGEGLEGLLRRINEQQLVTGRLGALLDFPENPTDANPLPFIALYNGETILNWDDSSDNIDLNKLSLVVLDESGFERQSDFQWKQVKRHRVLADGAAVEAQMTGYLYGVFTDTNTFDPSVMKRALYRGRASDTIPFVFINTKDNLARPDNPPLLPVAHAAKAVYQSEGDYRQALFLQGQDTLVVIGGVKRSGTEADDDTRVGAGAMIEVEQGGDAKYIGVSATGLPELRQALENDYKRAEARTGQLVNTMGSGAESGDALQTRLGAQTATLKQIAKTGAAGLEQLLRIAARWMGLDETKVKVSPNLEFADLSMTGKDLVDLMTAKNMGAPISNETVHDNMKSRGLTKRTFDEEMGLVNDETPVLGTLAGGGHPNLNKPPEDNSNTPPAKDDKK